MLLVQLELVDEIIAELSLQERFQLPEMSL
jgi:hypothetical protein